MADGDRRLVWSSPEYAIVEHGPRLEFCRRGLSELWVLVPLHLLWGGMTIAGVLGQPWTGLFTFPLWMALFLRVKPDPLGVGPLTTLAALDRRLGVVDLGMKPIARLDEIEASVVHDVLIEMDAIEVHGPDLHVRIVELPTGSSERLVVELRALGLPMRGDAISYRSVG